MIIEIAFILFFILLTIHYVLFISNINRGIEKTDRNSGKIIKNEFISIIIPFRNESENIIDNLRCIENQDYPTEKYEVLYVNDSSEDDGVEKLSAAIKNKNIKILHAPSNELTRGHKKNAVNYGIKNSSASIIVTTDADCTFGANWLSSLLLCLDEKTAFVSGPVKFSGYSNLFEKIQAIEFSGLVLAGAGLIGSGKPVICNAANIAYRKNIFDEVNGFNDNLNLSSGDDELLMQKIASLTNYKIKFCFNKNAVVETSPNKTLSSFINQRKRWASKSIFYKDKLLIAQLILIYLFYTALLMLPFLSILSPFLYVPLFILSFGIKILTEHLVVRKGKNIFSLHYSLFELIIAEIFQIFYIVIISAAGLFGRFKWKERNLER